MPNRSYTALKVLAVFAAVSIGVYFTLRVLLTHFSGYSGVEQLLAVILLLAEGFLFIHSYSYLLSVLRSEKCPRDYPSEKSDASVAIVVAARDEPLALLRETLLTLKSLNYPNKRVFLLSDSSKSVQRREKELCAELGVELFTRKKQHGAKAGIINDFIKGRKEKYLAIFDADYQPFPDFLSRLVPILDSDKNIAFVQTPQFYSNIEKNPISRAAQMQQSVFYEHICEGRSVDNSLFCCGTNVVFRISALRDVGGFDEDCVTEDFATSLKIHKKGYKSIYYPHVLAFGEAPQSLSSYFKQQSRWATGDADVFRRIVGTLFKAPRSLSHMQYWEYLMSGSYYFVGFVFFILMLFPILYLTTGMPSYFAWPEIYLGSFLPYVVFTSVLFYSSMLRRNYAFGDIYHGSIMSFLSFPVYMRAVLNGLLGRKSSFVKTPKGRQKSMSFSALWPYALMIILNIVALMFGTWRILSTGDPYSYAVNMVWCGYHIFILSHIYYFNGKG
jgi:cellulose synthase (UDP-forming)